MTLKSSPHIYICPTGETRGVGSVRAQLEQEAAEAAAAAAKKAAEEEGVKA
jgi:hypothetical protein